MTKFPFTYSRQEIKNTIRKVKLHVLKLFLLLEFITLIFRYIYYILEIDTMTQISLFLSVCLVFYVLFLSTHITFHFISTTQNSQINHGTNQIENYKEKFPQNSYFLWNLLFCSIIFFSCF